ncbi:hypothetical protein Trydic_g11293 [Trypoxylus dichotomus]
MSVEKPLSGLAYIEINDPDPFKLFEIWKEEVSKYGNMTVSAMNLATCSRNYEVSNRNVLILKYEADGFTFLTTKHGRKVKEINENPNVASTFLWTYAKEQRFITRQVRIEGSLKEIDEEDAKALYNAYPVYFKIRSHICQQNQPVEWQALKDKHDEFLSKIVNQETVIEELKMPDYMVGFKLFPQTMEFYYSYDNFIADRVKFVRTMDTNTWNYCHIQA